MEKAVLSASQNSLFKGSIILFILMIFGMVIIGGLTRLTGSGLSIVEWKPIMGIFPPLTQSDWLIEFSKYQQSPEFQKINFRMALSDFRSIFWLEYIHRLWGRLLGVVLLVPTFLMVFKRQHRELWPFLVLVWVLGIAQGIMGWIMVKSGLGHHPHVSPYRLATHLCLGFALFGIVLWMIFSIYFKEIRLKKEDAAENDYRSLIKLSLSALLLVVFTAFYGALVAGHKAGFFYNTFPLMEGKFIPNELLKYSPWWRDFLENPVSVQFLHRLLACITLSLCVGIWVYQRKLEISPRVSYALVGVALTALLQFSFGVATLLFMVPLSLGVFHQGFAFILFGSLLYTLFLLQAEHKCSETIVY